jgi:hypothetical protein
VYRDRACPTALHAMVMLTGKSCLIAQVLLVDLLYAEEMPKFCGCCDKFVWPSTPPEDWETTWDPVL